MYTESEENRFLEVTYANGDKEVLYFKDFNSGAMIQNIVDRAKKMAIKDFLDHDQKGLRVSAPARRRASTSSRRTRTCPTPPTPTTGRGSPARRASGSSSSARSSPASRAPSRAGRSTRWPTPASTSRRAARSMAGQRASDLEQDASRRARTASSGRPARRSSGGGHPAAPGRRVLGLADRARRRTSAGTAPACRVLGPRSGSEQRLQPRTPERAELLATSPSSAAGRPASSPSASPLGGERIVQAGEDVLGVGAAVHVDPAGRVAHQDCAPRRAAGCHGASPSAAPTRPPARVVDDRHLLLGCTSRPQSGTARTLADMSVRRVMGTETEYGISVPGNRWPTRWSPPRRSSTPTPSATVRARRARWDFEEETPLRDARGFDMSRQIAPTRRQLTDEDLGLANVILTNGARLYVDHAHPEYSTPEVHQPARRREWDKAGERIMPDAADPGRGRCRARRRSTSTRTTPTTRARPTAPTRTT